MAKKVGDRPELLTKEEMGRLINVVAGDLYFTTLYSILRYSGRRIGELYGTMRDGKLFGGVKFKDVDLDNGFMQTIILKTKKRQLKTSCSSCGARASVKDYFCKSCGSKMPDFDREKLKYSVNETIQMPLDDRLTNILKNYLENRKPKFKENDYIFRKYSLVYLKKAIKTHCKKASINKNFSLHGFRHYFVSQCKRDGISNEDIAKWTGHVSPSTLNIYNQLVPKDVQGKIGRADL